MKFVGEVGEDGGGPKREFWALLSKQVAATVFIGREDHRVLPHDAIGLQVSITDI